MGFTATAEAYDRYMGRYSRLLAPEFVEFAGVAPGETALDVGCGPGALTAALAATLGPERVAAADPAEQFARSCGERTPGVDARRARAEELPWPDGSFDAALAQLVVNFFADHQAGIAEMRRVTRPGGVVAACTWDYEDGMRMLRLFWDAARSLDPDAPDEHATMRLCSEDDLREAWQAAGLHDVETGDLVVEAAYEDFDDFWDPFLDGVGPAGAYVVTLDAERQASVREACRARLAEPEGPFTLRARACAVRGVA